MLRLEGLKEFDIQKIDDTSQISKDFQLVFSDDTLDEKGCEIVENNLSKHDFHIKDENIKINVIYNVDLATATITLTVYCPLMDSNRILEEKLSSFIDKHRANFEEYYKQIKPY
jgi:hypothetical protein